MIKKTRNIRGSVATGLIMIGLALVITYSLATLIKTPTDEFTSKYQPTAESGWTECNNWEGNPNYDSIPCREMALWWAGANGARIKGKNFYDNFDLPLPPSGDKNSPYGGTDQQWYDWGMYPITPIGKFDHFLSHDTACGIGPGASDCSPVDCSINLSPNSIEFKELLEETQLTVFTDDSIDKVEFVTSEAGKTILLNAEGVEVSNYTDNSSKYSVVIKSKGEGLAEVTAKAFIGDLVCDIDKTKTTFNIIRPESCTIESFSPPNPIVELGGTRRLIVNIDPISQYYEVSFTSSSPGIVRIKEGEEVDKKLVYDTYVEGMSMGSAEILAQATIGEVVCTPLSTTATVGSPGAWWQVIDGDATSGASMISMIPDSCNLPVCEPFLIRAVSGASGVVSTGGSLTGVNSVSENDWVAEGSPYSAEVKYDYSFFKRKLADNVSLQEIGPNIGPGTFIGGALNDGGYRYYIYNGKNTGDLTLNGNMKLEKGEKAILFVENASFNINGKINLADKNSFFMVISQKDINISPSVGDSPVSPSDPDLEGIYVADRQFKTGTSANENDKQLHIKGSVAGFGYGVHTNGVFLERNLSDNAQYPAEVFEHSPNLVLLIPRLLSNRRYEWREVAP